MSESFSFKRSDYDAVFNLVLKKMEMETKEIPKHVWIYWHNMVKKFFTDGFLIHEITAAIDEAFQKKHWPTGKKFWERIEDVMLKNRIENQRRNPVQIKREPESIAEVLDRVIASYNKGS